jgi:ligand-binding sensor domain-containing protein
MIREIASFIVISFLACETTQAADAWKTLTKEENGLPGNEVQFIKADESGTVWIGTRSGLASFSKGSFTTHIKEGEIWDILKTGEEKYWVGTAGGVALLSKGSTEMFLKGSTVAPLIRGEGGAVWAISKNRGTETNALVQSAGGDWAPVEKFKSEKVVDLTRTSDGTLWVVIDGNGVFTIPPGKSLDSAVRHLEGSNVTTVFEDSKHRVWCGIWQAGVAVYDGAAWTRHLKKERSYIFSITEDARGRIWIATNQTGLWRQEGEEWVNDLKEEGGINLLARTSDGRVWISTQMQGGLRYWDGKAWIVSLDSPLPIRCLFELNPKEIWAGGILDGLHILKR